MKTKTRVILELVFFTIASLLVMSAVHTADHKIMQNKVDSLLKRCAVFERIYSDSVFGSSEERRAPYLYKIGGPDPDTHDFVGFEYYMWAYGFPDTIIVRFTRDGKFERYDEAYRSGILEDEYGNAYSPAYMIRCVNGDNFTYDLKGHFIEFNADYIDNPGRDSADYKP